MPQPTLNRLQIELILAGVKFMDGPSVSWIRENGWLLQMQYMEPDVTKPGSEPMLQGTRKWYISPYMSESEIVETAWACVQRSMLHVASEHFTYQGARIYSQHFNVAARLEVCANDDFDGRVPR